MSDESGERIIAHVDMDAFYAQVEKLDDPDLRNEPVIVGGLGSRGVVATASYEAREYGVNSAMPMSRARELCPDAFYVAPRFERYEDISDQIRSILDEAAESVETVSLDEAYLDVTDVIGDSSLSPMDYGKRLRKAIRDKTKLTASVGIGSNKLVAKMASEHCKPNGLQYVPDNHVKEFLASKPIGSLRGIGDKTERRMNQLEIDTIGDLQEIDLGELQTEFDERAIVYKTRAQGEASNDVSGGGPSKSISSERTFSDDLTDSDEMVEELNSLTSDVCSRLDEKELQSRTVTIKVRFEGYDTITRSRSFDQPIQDHDAIWERVRDLFINIDRDDRGVRLLGVGLSQLYQRGNQKDLFQSSEDEGLEGTSEDSIVNKINEEYGDGTMVSAKQLTD